MESLGDLKMLDVNLLLPRFSVWVSTAEALIEDATPSTVDCTEPIKTQYL